MTALYIVSPERTVGKTAISAGIGHTLQGTGKKIGFFKPLFGEKPTEGDDNDAAFLKQTLTLPESLESICPFLGNEEIQANKIEEAYSRIARGKDLVLVEGILGQHANDNLSKMSYKIAAALNAKVIIVEAYSSLSSEIKDSYKGFGEGLLGIILNKIPESQLKRVNDEITPRFIEAGLNVLGVFPEDRALSSINISELADCLQGKILNAIEKSSELIENIMLGAMVVDSGLAYFDRMNNKAVIIRSDRPDMQLAALETPTRCLILSGDMASPAYSVLQKAENKGIPIILTDYNTGAIVTSIEDTLGNARFAHEKKLPIITDIMRRYFNFQAVNKGLGLAA